MTDKEIIKARAHFEYGIKCDIFKEPVVSYVKTAIEAFDEINRQQAEIERLIGDVTTYKVRWAKAEASRDTAKSEAIKEFTNRVRNYIKTKCNPYGKPTFDYETSIAIMHYIDSLVKEMVGDE